MNHDILFFFPRKNLWHKFPQKQHFEKSEFLELDRRNRTSQE